MEFTHFTHDVPVYKFKDKVYQGICIMITIEECVIEVYSPEFIMSEFATS